MDRMAWGLFAKGSTWNGAWRRHLAVGGLREAMANVYVFIQFPSSPPNPTAPGKASYTSPDLKTLCLYSEVSTISTNLRFNLLWDPNGNLFTAPLLTCHSCFKELNPLSICPSSF